MRKATVHTEAIKEKVIESIRNKYSRIEGKKRILEISNPRFSDSPEYDNYSLQKKLINQKKTLAASLVADVSIKDLTGKTIDSKKEQQLCKVPIVSNRHSFLISGKEYIVHNQIRLRPGIYTKTDRNDLPVADFNLSRGKNFSLLYMPAKQQIFMKVGASHIPLYTLLKDVYGLLDSQLERGLGKEIHKTESESFNGQSGKHLEKLYKAMFQNRKDYKLPADKDTIRKEIKEAMAKTEMEPALNKMTMDIPYSTASVEAILHAAKDVMAIYQQKKEPTWKDNLAFKTLFSTEDFLSEKFTKKAPEVHMKLKGKIDRADKVKDLMLPYYFNKLVDEFFVHSDLVNYPIQVNPMEFMENAHKITSLGEGGISSTDALPLDARGLHGSNSGFIDPVRTPDNMRAGIDNRVAIGAWKDGNSLSTFAFKPDGTRVTTNPAELYDKIYTFKQEKPDNSNYIKAFHKGRMVEVPKSKVQFYLDARAMFTVTSASIPFMENTHPQRGAMGSKMLTQSLSLVDREAPLVSTVLHNKVLSKQFLPVAETEGKVTKIEKDFIEITDSKGEKHKHNIPDIFPLNYHSYLHVDPIVKVGDTVEKGDVLGESNFSKGGKMALGKNLKVAFLPMKGYNYEDAMIVTQTGASKLRSNHVFQEELEIPDDSVLVNQEKFVSYYPNKFSLGQLNKLNKSVVKKGTNLESGDPIILAMKKKRESPEVLVIGKMSSRISNPYNDISIIWTKDYPGEVVEVTRDKKFIRVVIKSVAPLQVGDKICNRYGGKGVISTILDDNEAPIGDDGEVPDVIINTAGIPSRKNISQVYETAVAKAIKATGDTTIDQSHFSHANSFDDVKKMLRDMGVKDTQNYTDPKTGKKIENVFDGYQYTLKLFKQAETNFAARAGGKYDIDLRPIRGGEEGAKSLGALEFYGFLGHKGGARNLLREAATYKAEYNPEVWKALLSGKPLPPPKPTFVFEKLKVMLQGAGVNIHKEGNHLHLMPFTDHDIEKLSNGEIKESSLAKQKADPITGLPYRPEEKGLFDPKVTGGLSGKNWAHINLAEPVINPMFEKPIRAILDLKKADIEDFMSAKKHIDVGDKKLTGGKAVKHLLDKIDIDRDIKHLEEQLENTRSISRKDKIAKKLKYLKALKRQGLKPGEAYVLNKMPVIPPQFRPIYPKEDGSVVVSDVNHLYRDLVETNNILKDPMMKDLGSESKYFQDAHKNLYENIKKVQGLDPSSKKQITNQDRDAKGFLKTIIGNSQVKYGYFQSKLLARQQDLIGRGTVIPDPTYSIDEVGLPEPMAWKLYSPFVIGQLVKNGRPQEKALEDVENKTQNARNVLMAEMRQRPVVLKRDPVLHKFGVMAFRPRLIDGKAIKTSTLVNKGFNMDYDGDSTVNSVFARFKGIDFKSEIGYESSYGLKGEHDVIHDESIRSRYGLINLRDFPRIEESKRTKGNVDFYDVPGGVEVLVLDNDKKVKWMTPESFSVHRDLTMVEVVTNTGRSIQVSTDDSVVTLNEELDIQKIQPANGVVMPRVSKPVEEFNLSKVDIPAQKDGAFELDYNNGYLVGTYVGDGEVSSGNDNCSAYVFFLKDLIGHGVHNKHLPVWFLEAPISFRKGLLAGLFDTDGTIAYTKTKATKKDQFQVNYCTASRRLAFEIVALCHSLDITASVSFSKTKKNEECLYVNITQEGIAEMQKILDLNNPSKAKNLALFKATETINKNKPTPPLSKERMKELQKFISDKKTMEAEKHRKFINRSIKHGEPLTKLLAKEVFSIIPEFFEEGFWLKWKNLVLDNELEWEVISEIKAIPEITEAYDLTIPPAYTMVTESGIVVWDTLAVHVPMTQDGIKDALGMLPSNNLFSPLNKSPMHVPAQETIMGLNLMTKPRNGTVVKHFPDKKSAIEAYKRGDIKINDLIEVNKI